MYLSSESELFLAKVDILYLHKMVIKDQDEEEKQV
jgi:hypothetical protein